MELASEISHLEEKLGFKFLKYDRIDGGGFDSEKYLITSSNGKYLHKIYLKPFLSEHFDFLFSLRDVGFPSQFPLAKDPFVFRGRPSVVYTYTDGNIKLPLNDEDVASVAKLLAIWHALGSKYVSSIGKDYGLTMVHGDFHPGHLVTNEKGLNFIDCDRIGVRHPAKDIGSFLFYNALGSFSNPEVNIKAQAILFIEKYMAASQFEIKFMDVYPYLNKVASNFLVRSCELGISPKKINKREKISESIIQLISSLGR